MMQMALSLELIDIFLYGKKWQKIPSLQPTLVV